MTDPERDPDRNPERDAATDAATDTEREPDQNPELRGQESRQQSREQSRERDPVHLIAMAFATGGGVGFIPLAPGTFGAVVGVLLFLAFSHLGFALYITSVAAFTAIGVWASDRAGRHFACADDGRIVIDEVVGQLLTLAPLVVLRKLPLGSVAAPYGDPAAWTPGSALAFLASSPFAALDVFFLLVVTGFVLFRLLDIWKPGAIGWAERRFSGGVGVMADDMMAGIFGAILLTLPAYAALAGLLERVAL